MKLKYSQVGGVPDQHGAHAGVLQEDEHLPGLPRDGEQEVIIDFVIIYLEIKITFLSI